ncbi:alpha-ketoglutarate-dependent dioxygenase alkB homolog 7, mitochondrial [Gadus chalcogrammus]|uniref:alpha-ketoglutarate-dependent dioxygenase alkB homolog 7, mitochondrial n=1 Tax=Gadus chalcogrammus TaxID=1042646 RepID=UPI0024C238BA|nr:alpha-ketoglutarate-dependent dioxygenase alkB homolog 7, mitochondrial [Gadus chalcogrammus]
MAGDREGIRSAKKELRRELSIHTNQHLLLVKKLSSMRVDHDMEAWIGGYLSGRPQYVRLQSGQSDVVMSNTSAPQGTVLSPFLFTIDTSDFSFNSGTSDGAGNPPLVSLEWIGVPWTSTLFFAGACWGGGIKAGESNRLNKLVKKASSVVGLELDSLEVVVEKRMRDKFKSILGGLLTSPEQAEDRLAGGACGDTRLASLVLEHYVDGSSRDLIQRLSTQVEVRTQFISKEEECALFQELEPGLKRKRYQFDHWDDAIHGYRETERGTWGSVCEGVLRRVKSVAFPEGSPLLGPVHVLDLDKAGFIKPHIDSIKFCGSTIAGLSLLSDSVMRLVKEDDAHQWLDLFLPRYSLYILRDTARYGFTHEILKDEQSVFRGSRVPRERRISVICRNLPTEKQETCR